MSTRRRIWNSVSTRLGWPQGLLGGGTLVAAPGLFWRLRSAWAFSILLLIAAVGHRVVHGGPSYGEPQRITAAMVEELQRLSAFDPEHLPEEILLTREFHRRLPCLPQVACFDTAFHHDLPRVAALLPIPRRKRGS